MITIKNEHKWYWMAMLFIVTIGLGMGLGWSLANTRHNVNSRNFEYGKKIGVLKAYEEMKDWNMVTAFMMGFDAALYLPEGEREQIRTKQVINRLETEKEAKEWFDEMDARIAKRKEKYYLKHKGDKK